MGTDHGRVVGTTKIVDHGPDDEKWCLVVTGDGFTSTEMSTFEAAVDDFVVYLEAHLTGVANWDKVNVIRMDVESDESGADIVADSAAAAAFPPPVDPVLGIFRDTYFDAVLRDRLLTVDDWTAMDAASLHFPEWDAVLVLVNITGYGGSGVPRVAAASLHPTDKHELALHELGHSAFDLADEYPYDSGDNYPAWSLGEPGEANVTATTSPLKWADSLDPVAPPPIPTTTNTDCTQADTQPSPVAPGTVGAFEGARYYHCDIWRAEYDCRMNHLFEGWCAVCAAAISNTLLWGTVLETGGGDCFVAGAVYRDPHHPDVVALRRWRDRHIQPGARGSSVMRFLDKAYRQVGPLLADIVRSRPRLVQVIERLLLRPVAAFVSSRED